VVAWYERDFQVPESCLPSTDWLTQLTFGACGYETRVWLNGQLLRTIEGEDVHYGEYNSFSYELPPEHMRTVNRLTVRISDSLAEDIPRGKQASRVYKQGGIWYQTISGAVRSVWIERVSRNRLRSRLAVASTIGEDLVEFDVTTRTHDPGVYTLRLAVKHRGGREPIVAASYQLELGVGDRVQRIPLQLPKAERWSPDAPHLYELVADLVSPTGAAAGIEAHFGLREIEARGSRIYLNGVSMYLDGILYQPGTSSFDEMTRHIRAMKRLGCNLVRVHIAGTDPRIYDLADELGMLLWVEVPSPHSSTQTSRDNHWAELQRMLVFIASHPSIVICSLYNEDWGAEDIATNDDTRRYIMATYDFLCTHLPQVLVVDNDGWNHISKHGRLKSHLLTAHVYTADVTRWQHSLDRLVDGNAEGVTAKPLVVGDPFFYRGQAPLVISEWGGFGWSGYGGPAEAQDKADRIAAFKRELRKRAIAGDVYTQATSIEEETNGVIDPQTGDLLVRDGVLKSAVPPVTLRDAARDGT
jgi:beta-galactosidase/beta-glucuronidase